MATTKKAVAKKAVVKKPTQRSLRTARALQPIAHPGYSFGPKHHVFVAKVKAGEIWALNQLSNIGKQTVTPLFEMWPPDPATPTKPAKTVLAHATDLLSTVRAEWGTLPLFLDTRYMPLGGIPSAQQAALVFGIARSLGLSAVPVTTLTASPAYQSAIANAVGIDARGAMIRLRTENFTALALLPAYLTALLGVLQLSPDQVDIALDLEYRSNLLEVQQLGQSLVVNLPFLNDWRTVTLISGCFPQVSPAQIGAWTSVQRVDWLGWLQVASAQTSSGARVISFGDYGVRCGGPPIKIPNTPAPYLRYSDTQNVLTRKGPKTNGALQAICADLVSRPEFAGALFSQGDAEIAARATMQGLQNNGQAWQWIQWCTNHHLELTAWQIRSLP